MHGIALVCWEYSLACADKLKNVVHFYFICLQGKFSTKTDVWSFGVTLWETLTFARQQPFEDLTDEQVIENCTHFFHGDNHHMLLPQPSNCPKEIYDLMRECWNKEETDRPSFKEIHMFLQRKNMGYDPRTEDRSSHNRISVPVV